MCNADVLQHMFGGPGPLMFPDVMLQITFCSLLHAIMSCPVHNPGDEQLSLSPVWSCGVAFTDVHVE